MAQLKEFRTLRHQHFDTVLKLDSMAKELSELETKETVQTFDSDNLKSLRNNLSNAVAEVNKWKRIIISQHDAEEQAKLEYMTKSEREIWLQYYSTVSHILHLQEFLKNLHKPKDSQADALKAYDDIGYGVKKKLISLKSSAGLLEKSIANSNLKLDSPDFKKNILLVTHQILQDNSFARKKLKQACNNLDLAVDQLRDDIFKKTVSNEKILDLKFNLQLKIISHIRAFSMAKNLFLHGALKSLRADLRNFHKYEQLFSKNISGKSCG